MAKGKKCPQCGYYLYAEREEYKEKGSWVWYVCRNSKCGNGHPYTEKVWEDSKLQSS